MKIDKIVPTALIASFLFFSSFSQAATVTFDDLVTGVTSHGYDGDGDSIDDVIFSTTDSGGFNTVGPGTNQLYINQPGLEGTAFLSPDLRVDFLNGAVTNFNFGFAMSFPLTSPVGVTFSIFDSADNSLNSIFQQASFTLPDGTNPSSFPEALVSLDFIGIASYALFDFSGSSERYIIDDFSGTFGSTEDITPSVVPVPAAIWLFGTAMIGLVGFGKRREAA
jgi:hypothetical protein